MAKEKDIAKGYTINFNEVKITEYIKFISKICDLNFIFQEKDLNFTITIISEHPIQKEDLMSTLIQTLRIHGFYLLENKEGIVIHKSTNVKQMPQIISQDEEITGYPPIITKIFQLKNIQVDIINNIIKSMISEEAILESIPQTNQIILTDIARNIQEISHFINEIDNSKSPLKIQIYSVASQIPIETLVSTTTQILTPLTGTNTLLLIPQNETKSIYMVASSYVLEECMMILTMLDESYKTKKILTADNIFLYTPTHKSIDFILTSLKKFTSNLSQLGFQEDLLNTTIKDSQVIEKTNSLLFISSKETTSQLKEILAILDVPTKEETDIASESFFIYSAKNLSSENLYKALLQIKENLKTLGLEKKSIYNSLEKVKIIEKPNVLMITGSKNTFEEIKDLLTSLDTEINANLKNANSFLIFTIKNSVDQQLLSTIKEINDNLKISTDIKDKELTHSLDNLKYLSKIHSLFIIGNESTLKEVDSLLTSLDSLQLTEGSAPSKNSNFLIYKPHYQSSEFISKYLKDIATNLEDSHLSDPHLIQSIQKMKVISNNNTMIFTGNPISLEKIQNILKTIDLPHKKLVPIEEETSYYIYKLQNINGNIIQQNIDSLISKLKSQDVKNPALIEALDSIKLIKETNSILITSTLPTIEEVKKIIAQYDIPRKGKSEQLQDEFFIYKPSYLTVPQLDKSIKDLSNNLEKANLADPNLLNSINSMQHSENSNSIIFTGSKDSLEKIKNLLSTLDVASAKSLFNGKASVILVYKIKQAPPEQLISSIQSLTNDLEKTSNAEKSFLGSLKSMKYENKQSHFHLQATKKSFLK